MIVRPTAKRRAAGTQPGDIVLSSHFACTECGISFEEPTPQLFSFNSPQGMCLTCDGLGEFFSFDPQRLAANPEQSFVQGCIELVGPWKDLGRWKRHIYRGVAETMERKLALAEGTLLETPWRELAPELRDIWLWGTGEEHITFTWRAGKAAQKYGGTFDGLIPELLEKYRTSNSEPQIRQLEQYMSVIRCPDCAGERLNPQARAVRIDNRQLTICRPAAEVAARGVQSGRIGRGRVFQRAAARRQRKADRGRGAEGNSRPARLPAECRPRIPHARSHGADALRRRIATHSAGRPNRLRPRRRAVHSRRTVDRPPPARQRTAARYALRAARPGQHGRRRRARRRHDAGGRSPHRLRPRPRRARRRGRRHRQRRTRSPAKHAA